MLTKGNFQAPQEQMQGLSDEQQREQTRIMIILQMRRYLRFFCIGMFFITFLTQIFYGHDFVGSFLMSLIAWGVAYAIFVYLFVYIAAHWTIKIFLYLKSLFGGAARL